MDSERGSAESPDTHVNDSLRGFGWVGIAFIVLVLLVGPLLGASLVLVWAWRTKTAWSELGFAGTSGPLLDAPWPQVDPAALVQDSIELVLQVNGKVRGKLLVPAGADRIAIETAAHAAPEVARHGGGGPVRKVIVVPGRLVNVVVQE